MHFHGKKILRLFQGNEQCYNCSGKLCENPTDDQIIDCPFGHNLCQFSINGLTLDSFQVNRTCGPSDASIHQCFGLREDKPKQFYNESSLMQEVHYLNVPFNCGSQSDCLGNYSTSDQIWNIYCQEVKQLKRCRSLNK